MTESKELTAWPADESERWELARLIPYAANSRIHTPEQVAQIAASLSFFGWVVPIVVDEAGVIIAGHGRVLAAQSLEWREARVVIARGWTDEKKRAYRIADNKLTENADWNNDALLEEFEALRDADFDLGLTGFSVDELEELFEPVDGKRGRGSDAGAGEPPAAPVTRPGDVWLLGAHRIICGDARDPDTLAELMNGKVARFLHADPPYGMGKESEGVANDNLYEHKLDEFQLAWWSACRQYLEPNASAFVWGNARDLWRFWWRFLEGREPLTFRNEIVWDKGSIAGMRSADLTQFPEASERALFFQLGRHVFLINRTKDDYWEGWEPIRAWLCEQRDAAGFGPRDVGRICENHMYGHWFGRSQWAFISRENYEKLARAADGRAFVKPFDELEKEYRQAARIWSGDIRGPRAEEFRAGRPYFDNAHDVMRDVWDFARVAGEEREGHPTPKPVAMAERAVKSAAREGEIVLEPFAGSGSTLIGCERTGRVCYTLEVEPAWVDVTVERWESLTGKAAVLGRTGEEFKRLKDARAQT